ncbi:hypothetical protein [Streptomyces sp. R44]|uniref:Uncharacterized protein n=1 Tax=Streptomyces sp. R44 TaxID=3238633 RepID=A0AB39TAG4_9ACTN
MNYRSLEEIADEMRTAEEGIQLKNGIVERVVEEEQRRRKLLTQREDIRGPGVFVPLPIWHWMGYYRDPRDVARIATNYPSAGPGELVVSTHHFDDHGIVVGLYATWMYYAPRSL